MCLLIKFQLEGQKITLGIMPAVPERIANNGKDDQPESMGKFLFSQDLAEKPGYVLRRILKGSTAEGA